MKIPLSLPSSILMLYSYNSEYPVTMKTTPWIKQCKGATLTGCFLWTDLLPVNRVHSLLNKKGDSLTIVHIVHPTHYILLPIEEEADESQVRLDTGNATDTDMDIRLAQTKVDYFVPFALPADAKTVTLRIQKKPKDISAGKVKLSIRLILPIRINSVISTIILPL